MSNAQTWYVIVAASILVFAFIIEWGDNRKR